MAQHHFPVLGGQHALHGRLDLIDAVIDDAIHPHIHVLAHRAVPGGGVRPGFEGGQLPIYRKLPKRGFTNHFSKEYAIINLGRLDELFDDGSVVDMETLLANGILRKELDGLKILGEGELTKKLTVKAKVFSASAKEKIEAAGGKAEVV